MDHYYLCHVSYQHKRNIVEITLMINVVAGVIYHGENILCFRKGPTKYSYTSFRYEFPGGKVEYGESSEAALKRELYEELNIDVCVDRKLTTIVFDYPDFSINMECFVCYLETGNIVLKDHISYVELAPSDLRSLNWIDADKQLVDLLTA